MKIRSFFAILMVALATSMFVTACDDDDDEEDVRDQAVGTYAFTTQLYVEDEGKLEPLADYFNVLEKTRGKELGVDPSDLTETGNATVSKSDNNKLLITDESTDGDTWLLGGIVAASNGFVFNVEATSVKDIKFTNYNGYKLEGNSTTYGGGYISTSNKLEFYIYTTMDDLLSSELGEEDIENIALLLKLGGLTDKEITEFVDAKVVVHYTLTKTK